MLQIEAQFAIKYIFILRGLSSTKSIKTVFCKETSNKLCICLAQFKMETPNGWLYDLYSLLAHVYMPATKLWWIWKEDI